MQRSKEKVVAVDFDGVIAEYSGFVSPRDEKPPIGETIEAVRQLKEKGYKILIHSSRSDGFLKYYCEKYDIPYDYINRNPNLSGENPGKPPAFVYIDDRAICFKKQNAAELVREVEQFKTYWKK